MEKENETKTWLKELGRIGRKKRLSMDSVKGKSNVTLEELAERVQVNKNTIARFEKGIPIRTDTLLKICNALGIPSIEFTKDELVEGIDYKKTSFYLNTNENEEPNSKYQYLERKDRVVIREEEGIKLLDFNNHINHIHQLNNGKLNAIVLEINGQTSSRQHEGEELLFCLTGKVGVRIRNTELILNKGDCINFWGKERHSYFNASEQKERSIALSVLCLSEFDLNHLFIGNHQ